MKNKGGEDASRFVMGHAELVRNLVPECVRHAFCWILSQGTGFLGLCPKYFAGKCPKFDGFCPKLSNRLEKVKLPMHCL